MRKLVISIFSVALVLCAAFYLAEGAGGSDSNEVTGVAEAAFFAPETGHTSDATPFLIGGFSASDGSKAWFDGTGGITFSYADGTTDEGKYALTQNADKTASAEFDFSGGIKRYTFELLSENGSFSLTNESSAEVITFTPDIF